ncbi:aspartate kinase [Natranaerobius trueperi]|uniref:Aspartokinase n=1 Tax=Natranaerobius trueperi TaxID=759412 RepID=A0A226BZF3_9FIRM|nr:aspartate kinase [Natranaerobius trueperi]OWZ84301.1 aspartate kinase [Natranaerobius trueperi]
MATNNVIVQKFGGSSLRTKELREKAVEHIKQSVDSGNKVVVVVSALGRKPDPYATDSLIDFLNGQAGEGVKDRELDLAVSCGEVISSALLTSLLNMDGYDAVALTGKQAGILTDNNYTNGTILDIDCSMINKYLDQNKIVVVAGFQGVSTDGETVTLGRGGSDTTATALASHLKADSAEIYTDVDGLMTVDPKIVPDAKPIKVITFYEVLQMARDGVKVIHPRAVEYAMRHSVPIYIKNIENSYDDEGTKITHNVARKQTKKSQIITGIGYLPKVTQITLDFESDCSQVIKVAVFNEIAKAKISLDMINVYENRLTFTVREANAKSTIELLKEGDFGDITKKTDCTKITLFGTGMTGLPGVMAKALDILNKEKIEVLQTTDSNITISCLIQGSDTERALRLLHEKFYL